MKHVCDENVPSVRKRRGRRAEPWGERLQEAFAPAAVALDSGGTV